jgi:hypothetical protein
LIKQEVVVMNDFFDALANAELSLFGILGHPYDAVAVAAGDSKLNAERDSVPAIAFDEAHYRLAAG